MGTNWERLVSGEELDLAAIPRAKEEVEENFYHMKSFILLVIFIVQHHIYAASQANIYTKIFPQNF